MTNSSAARLLLCVDNDVDSCSAFKARLSAYRVMEAHAADTGIRLARRFSYDLYLVNAELPNGGAIKFCRVLRRFKPKAPIIAYNAPEKPETHSAFIVSGMKIYLVGPSSTASLTTMITNAIDGSRVESRSAGIAESATAHDALDDRSAFVGVLLQNGQHHL